MPKPSSRIATWLRDYDPLLSIHWSPTLHGWAIERKGQASEALQLELHKRINMAFRNVESGSAKAQYMDLMQMKAKGDLEAIARGNRLLFALPDPLDESALKMLVVGGDTWRELGPEEPGTDAGARKATTPVYDAQDDARKKREASQQQDNRYKAADAARYFFAKLGSRNTLKRGKQAA